MLNRNSLEDVLQTALRPGKDCPAIEELERLVSKAAPESELSAHVKSCPYCQTELHLLRTFEAAEVGETSDEVRRTAALLQKRSQKIIRLSVPTEERVPWWRAAFTIRSLAQASLALAVILAVAAVVIHLRTNTQPPSLNEGTRIGQDVLRSGGFAVTSPVGDLNEAPKEVRWEKVPNVACYRIRLLEVDRNELWKADTTENHIELPPSVRSLIVPAKTLFFEISAFDASGGKVGDTGLVRFRLQTGIGR